MIEHELIRLAAHVPTTHTWYTDTIGRNPRHYDMYMDTIKGRTYRVHLIGHIAAHTLFYATQMQYLLSYLTHSVCLHDGIIRIFA